MASVVDICNLALGHLGDSATVASIDPPEGSAQAQHCARFYGIARDFLLEKHDWNFASRRVALADMTNAIPPPSAWTYTYALPGNCVRFIGVYDADASHEDEKQPFAREISPNGQTSVIYTHVPQAACRYTTRVTDTTRFSPMFVDALARLLASYLAGPVIKGDRGAKMATQWFNAAMAVIGQAEVSDANQKRSDTYKNESRNSAPWLGGRGRLA